MGRDFRIVIVLSKRTSVCQTVKRNMNHVLRIETGGECIKLIPHDTCEISLFVVEDRQRMTSSLHLNPWICAKLAKSIGDSHMIFGLRDGSL